jgi:preprotein translocase subunit Sec61beta
MNSRYENKCTVYVGFFINILMIMITYFGFTFSYTAYRANRHEILRFTQHGNIEHYDNYELNKMLYNKVFYKCM